jgi:hypothetical protein
VWDIVPVKSERRTADRRECADVRVGDRRLEDRRVTLSRRAVLRGTYASGWLCFESDHERRRLSPIPHDWRSCSDALVETYARHAELVPHARSATGESFAEWEETA